MSDGRRYFDSDQMWRRNAEMASANKTEIIRRLFAAYLANDRKSVEAAFTDDFRFTS
jgi:hypothetical protein